EPRYDLAAEAVSTVEQRRAAVGLLTSVVDLAAAEILRTALLDLARRHRVLLVNLEDPGLVRLAHRPPPHAPGAFATTASLEILLANRRLGRRLRRGGITVVVAAADQLAWRTLEGYLAAASRFAMSSRRLL